MTKSLEALSKTLADAVEAGGDSVVRVEGRRRLPSSGILWKEAGYVLTASHALQREDRISVGLPSGDATVADLVGRDQSLDLALLKIDQSSPNSAWDTAGPVRVGHFVLALGRPTQDVMATHGIVSALGTTSRRQSPQTLIQTDVVMYPGFSGGPLVNSQGLILGMNTSGLVRGVSVTLPTETIAKSVRSLQEFGYIKRGYLGVGIQPIRLAGEIREAMDQETGLLITVVEEGSPAKGAGLIQGDILVAIEQTPLGFPDDLLNQLSSFEVGREVALSIIRAGQKLEVSTKIGERG